MKKVLIIENSELIWLNSGLISPSYDNHDQRETILCGLITELQSTKMGWIFFLIFKKKY